MRYEECINFLYGLQPIGIKFGLSNTITLLSALGSPHNKLRCIHVAGTNGKGSTCAMIASILKTAGFKTGLYTSPHLVDISERIQINGTPISRDELIECVTLIMNAIEEIQFKDTYPTYFEVLTVCAFYYFASRNVDFAIFETGMGGRLDATNVIEKPLITIITNIELEHKAYLGDTIENIAFEKAGIIKLACPLICGEKKSQAYAVIKKKAAEHNAPLFWVPELYHYVIEARSSEGYSITVQRKDRVLATIHLPLLGDYQIQNLLLILESVRVLNTFIQKKITEDHLRQGLLHTHWPGRMHIIQRNPYIILDGAHNPPAAQELASSIPKVFSYNTLILIIGILNDKDIGGICTRVVPIADYLIITSPKFERRAAPEKVRDIIYEHCSFIPHTRICQNLLDALREAQEIASPKDLILVTGSLYVVGEALEILHG
ncbi:MAG: bifunctional folylpolyglutamate synthase/dihydrofolate synthase [bacterium]